jgi:ATP-dependent protease HslVU (ClpYQ) ATPase subunit
VKESKNKKPAELALQRALIPVSVLTSSAPHPRRRAMRVMVVMMVMIQHESKKLLDAGQAVNSENSIMGIVFVDET